MRIKKEALFHFSPGRVNFFSFFFFLGFCLVKRCFSLQGRFEYVWKRDIFHRGKKSDFRLGINWNRNPPRDVIVSDTDLLFWRAEEEEKTLSIFVRSFFLLSDHKMLHDKENLSYHAKQKTKNAKTERRERGFELVISLYCPVSLSLSLSLRL